MLRVETTRAPAKSATVTRPTSSWKSSPPEAGSYDRIQKKALYESAGVTEYWIIDPDAKAIEVFTLTKGAYQLHSKATGKAPAKSKLLAGFKTNFMELTA